MAMYVIFGGVKAAGLVGVVKLVLLYVAMIGGGLIVLHLTGGLTPLLDGIHGVEAAEGNKVNFLSLFARGAGKDIGAGVSLILGVLTTQSYAQAVIAGRNDKQSRIGALASAVLIPPIGAGGILIGMYMRVHAAEYAGLGAKTALTEFIMHHMPPLLGGVVLATLLIAVVGTGAGLSLGISTILNNDIVKKITHKFDEPKKNLLISRVFIIAVLVLACVMSEVLGHEAILSFAFMSMGLRGSVIFMPMVLALWAPRRVDSKFIIASVVISPLCVLLFGIPPLNGSIAFDSLFIGMAVSVVICLAGLAIGKGKRAIGN
jgi:SSS family solute:Na+ symporter